MRRAKWERLQTVCRLMQDLSSYWPLTLRQVFYQLVAAMVVGNSLNNYKRLSELLSDARIAGWVPWEAMEDRSRPFLSSSGWTDTKHFVQSESDTFMSGYRRDLLQTQEHNLEVWVEKDALAQMAHGVAFPYCVSVASARGYTSTDYLNKLRLRAEDDGRVTRILYYGDFDPSGYFMPRSMLRKLEDQMGLHGMFELQHVALLPDIIKQHNLPEDFNALKEADVRTPAFRREFGDHVAPVELDALPPAIFEQLVGDTIAANLDLSAFKQQQELEVKDRKRIAKVREKVIETIEPFLA